MVTSSSSLYGVLALLSSLQLTEGYCYGYCYAWWSSWYIWTVVVVVIAICCGVGASLCRKRHLARAQRQAALRVQQQTEAGTAPPVIDPAGLPEGAYPRAPSYPATGAGVPAAGAFTQPGSIYFVNVNNMMGPPSYQQATSIPPSPHNPNQKGTDTGEKDPPPPTYSEALGHENPAGPNPVFPDQNQSHQVAAQSAATTDGNQMAAQSAATPDGTSAANI